jgi:DNA-binding IclR family transcriptional regulator
VQSADRALAILAAFDERRRAVGVTELAAELGLHKSTVSRLLAALEKRGLVRRDGDRFVPGWELARLGGLALQGLALVDAARRPLEQLAADTGETVNLAVAQGRDRVLNILQVDGAHLVGVTDWTGRTTPLDSTANGKVLVAFGAASSKSLSPGEVDRIRTQGYATALGELEPGLHAVAAPVFDASGACIAAVSVAGPAYRLTTDRLADLGRQCIAASEAILPWKRAA